MIKSTLIWTPKLRVNPKMNPKVNPKTMKRYAKLWRWWTENPESGQEKVDKKRKKVERKFRMTPKMTVKVTPKRQRMILKTKGMTLKKPRMTPRTELL